MVIEKQQLQASLEVLKAFSGVVTATRLFTATAPQVSTAFDRALSLISACVKQYGNTQFGLRDSRPLICGEFLEEGEGEVLQKISIFKQFELLKLDNLVFNNQLNQAALKQIIFVFTSRKEKIAREGGGRSFVQNLELEQFFPEKFVYTAVKNEIVTEKISQRHSFNLEGLLTVDQEIIDCLLGVVKTSSAVSKLKAAAKDIELVISLFLHGICQIYQNENNREGLFIDQFAHSIEGLGYLLDENDCLKVARESANQLYERSSGDLLCRLIVQKFSGKFGEKFFSSLQLYLDIEQFKKSMVFLRSREGQLLQEGGSDSAELQLIRTRHTALIETRLGKQFLGLESTDTIVKPIAKKVVQEKPQNEDAVQTQSEISIADDEATVIKLPAEVEDLLEKGADSKVGNIVDKLLDKLGEAEKGTQPNLSMTCCLIGDILVREKRFDLVKKMTGYLTSWVKDLDNGDFVYEKYVTILQSTVSLSLAKSDREFASEILSLFRQIRIGKLKKSGPVKALVGRVQDKNVDTDILNLLLKEFLTLPEDNGSGRLIIAHGPHGVKFLISALVDSETSVDRMKLLDLLGSAEDQLPPIILKCLTDPMPWYGKRNLVKLLSETGSEVHAEKVVDILRHADLRVQRETFICIYKIGGSRKQKLLLQALPIASETILVQVLKALGGLGDEAVAKALVDVLAKYEDYSENNREKILVQAFQTLVNCKSMIGLKALRDLLPLIKKRGETALNNNVVKEIEQSISILGRLLGSVEDPVPDASSSNTIHEQQSGKELRATFSEKKIGAPSETFNTVKVKEKKNVLSITFLPEEKQIRNLLAEGKEDEGRSQLVELIKRCAQQKKFEFSDKLREWLIELAPMALSDIIHTAEIIEEEKSQAIDKGHMEVWADLYDVLTTDEFSTLYHSMQHRKYNGEDSIVKQHTLLSALFFINSGKVKLFYRENESEVLIKTVGQGEVLGVDSFFDASVWTINASTMGRADVSMLRLDKLQQWKDEYPALESKLNDFCIKFESLKDYFQKSRRDRREDNRTMINGRVSSVLLDKQGNPTKISSKGDLADVSRGGASFFMRISNKENTRILLGNKIRLQLPAVGSSGNLTTVNGVIVAVRGHLALENEYSVHVKLDSKLSHNDLQKVVRASKE